MWHLTGTLTVQATGARTTLPLMMRGCSDNPVADSLADMLAALAGRFQESPAREIGEFVREMDEASALYLEKRDAGTAPRAYKQWRSSQLRRITRLRGLLCAQE
jgi:hypothetical protein